MNLLWIGKTGKANAWYHISLTASADIVDELYVVRHEPPVREITSKKVSFFLFNEKGFLPYIFRMFFTGYKLNQRKKIDAIITFNVSPYGIMAYFLSLITRKKLVLCFIGADYHTHLFKQPNRFFILKALKRSSLIILKGRNMRSGIIEAGIDESKLAYYPHFVSDELLSDNTPNEAEYDIINVSDFIPRKQVHIIVEAIKILRDKGFTYKVCILGDGPLFNEISDLINKYELNDQITLTGFVKNVQEYLKKGKVFLQASRGEGLSLALLEGIACNLIPVVTEAGGERDIIVDDNNGYLIKNADPVDMAEKITLALSNENYERISNNLSETKKTLSLESASEKINQIFINNLISK